MAQKQKEEAEEIKKKYDKLDYKFSTTKSNTIKNYFSVLHSFTTINERKISYINNNKY